MQELKDKIRRNKNTLKNLGIFSVIGFTISVFVYAGVPYELYNMIGNIINGFY